MKSFNLEETMTDRAKLVDTAKQAIDAVEQNPTASHAEVVDDMEAIAEYTDDALSALVNLSDEEGDEDEDLSALDDADEPIDKDDEDEDEDEDNA